MKSEKGVLPRYYTAPRDLNATEVEESNYAFKTSIAKEGERLVETKFHHKLKEISEQVYTS